MTTPLFRKGHLYALGARATTIIGRYAGAEKGYYCFKTIIGNKPFPVYKDDLNHMVIDRIGSDNAKVYC